MPRKVTLKAKKNQAPVLRNREFIIRYEYASKPLTEAQKKQLIRNIKKNGDYFDYLSGKFKYSFADSENFTEGTYLWKGGAGNWHEAGDRVPALLLGYYGVLPEGVTSMLISSKEV